MINPAKRLDRIEPYYFSTKLSEIKQRQHNGEHIINMGIGNPDLLPPPNVVNSLRQYAIAQDANGYQAYKGIPDLRNAFAEWYATHFNVEINPEEEVLPLIGSKEGVFHISMTFLDEGDTVLVPNPGYLAYQSCAKMAGAEIQFYNLVEENNFRIDFRELESFDFSNIKMMWVNYPHMPTGKTFDAEEISRLIDLAVTNDFLLCFDNPYFSILSDEWHSVHQLKGIHPNVLELVSLSKAYHMAGWRVGAVTGHKLRIDNILKFKSNVDSGMYKPIQQAACEALLTPRSWFDAQNELYKLRKERAKQLLDLLGCEYDQGQTGMFVWAKIPVDYTGSIDFTDQLLDKTGIFIAPGIIFGSNADRYVRISLCVKASAFDKAIALIKQNILKHSIA